MTRLSSSERLFLLIPFLGGAVFGIAALLFPRQFASITGYSGNDEYIYQLAGAATIGYAIALWNAIKRATWHEGKYIVLATFVFNLFSLYACGVELMAHRAKPVVYSILVASLIIVCITGRLVMKHRLRSYGRKNISDFSAVFLGLATLAALLFGLLPLFPHYFAQLFQLQGTDAFVYRQAGAATLGYAVMGIMEMRSRVFDEIDLPMLMAIVFNGLAFAVSAYQFIQGYPSLLLFIVGGASFFFIIGLITILFREGK